MTYEQAQQVLQSFGIDPEGGVPQSMRSKPKARRIAKEALDTIRQHNRPSGQEHIEEAW